MDAFKLDPLSWNILRAVRRKTNLEPIASERTVDRCVRELCKLGLTRERKEASAPAPFPPIKRRTKFVVNAADFHVTHNCNMRCKYCYGLNEDVEYLKTAGDMSVQTAHDAVDFLARHADPKLGVRIIFFGGEPLLNLEVVRETVRYARQVFAGIGKPLGFAITTNGTIMSEEILNLMNREKFSVMVSLDGPKEVQDVLRPLKDGESSYDRITSNIEPLLKSRCGRVTSRATICGPNIDIVALARHSKKIGFAQGVFSPESGVVTHEFQSTTRELLAAYERLTDYVIDSCIEGVPDIVEPFKQVLLLLFFNQRRLFPCGAGRTYVAISPTGEIYPCHRFMGDSLSKLGDIYAGTDLDKAEVYWSRNSREAKSCSECWARSLCGGGCPHRHYQGTNDVAMLSREECRMVRRLIELGIFLAFQLQERATTFLDQWMEMEKAAFERRMKMLHS